MRSTRVLRAGVVEARRAVASEADLAAHRLHPAHEVVRHARILHRHEVGDLRHAIGGQEPGEQHVGVGQVKLLVPRRRRAAGDLEAAAALRVEQRGEHRRRIEAREAHEVDRAVLRDQRDGVQVADDAVVLDRLELGHGVYQGIV